MAWNYRKWATLEQPVHKSDLQQLTGGMFGCARAFKFQKDALDSAEDPPATVNGKSALGTATHETINRALANREVVDRLLGGGRVTEATVEKVFRSELQRACDGREMVWFGKSDNPDKLAAQKISMVTGLLNDLHRHVAEVVLVEPGFIAKLGDYWIAGQVDLIYRPRSNPQGLAFTDWKSGATVPHPLELEHGFESGFYAHALREGSFLPREQIILARTEGGQWAAECAGAGVTVQRQNRFAAERACMEASLIELISATEPPAGVLQRFDAFPDELHYVHLQDYVPYEKAGSKKVDRPEHLAYYGVEHLAQVKYVKGDLRGPGWYPMARRESDVPRLRQRLRDAVRMVRMGVFIDSIEGNKCKRCPFKQPCLTSGYELRGDEARDLARAMNDIDFDGLGGEAA